MPESTSAAGGARTPTPTRPRSPSSSGWASREPSSGIPPVVRESTAACVSEGGEQRMPVDPLPRREPARQVGASPGAAAHARAATSRGRSRVTSTRPRGAARGCRRRRPRSPSARSPATKLGQLRRAPYRGARAAAAAGACALSCGSSFTSRAPGTLVGSNRSRSAGADGQRASPRSTASSPYAVPHGQPSRTP